MSSCAASCSICCRRASCASATSASSPTATALRCCRYASNCSAAQRKHRFAGITVHRSDPLTLELPSLRRNHARRRTALRRATPASLSTSTRPVRSMKLYPHPRPLPVLRRVRGSPCLIWPEPLACQPLQPPDRPLVRVTAPLHPAFKPIRSYPTQSVPDPSAPAQTDSKYIAFHEGGFLQVAVSEAPR